MEGQGEQGFTSLCDKSVADNFGAICKSVEAGRERLKAMINFWRSLVSLEDTYSKGLASISSSDPAGDSFFSFKWFKKDDGEDQMTCVVNSWSAIKAESLKLATHHNYLATSINTYILPLLVTFLQDTEVPKKSHFSSGEAHIADLKRARDTVESTKQRYYKAAKQKEEIETTIQSTPLPTPYKLTQQLDTLTLNVSVCNQKYKDAVDHCRLTQTTFYGTQMAAVLKNLQDLEEKRIALVKTTLEKFASIRQATLPVLRELLDHVTESIEEIASNTDIQNFVKNRKQMATEDLTPPPLPVYEPYGETPIVKEEETPKPIEASTMTENNVFIEKSKDNEEKEKEKDRKTKERGKEKGKDFEKEQEKEREIKPIEKEKSTDWISIQKPKTVAIEGTENTKKSAWEKMMEQAQQQEAKRREKLQEERAKEKQKEEKEDPKKKLEQERENRRRELMLKFEQEKEAKKREQLAKEEARMKLEQQQRQQRQLPRPPQPATKRPSTEKVASAIASAATTNGAQRTQPPQPQPQQPQPKPQPQLQAQTRLPRPASFHAGENSNNSPAPVGRVPRPMSMMASSNNNSTSPQDPRRQLAGSGGKTQPQPRLQPKPQPQPQQSQPPKSPDMEDKKALYIKLMGQLQQLTVVNDYYRLFELTDETNNSYAYVTGISLQDISKRRRELTQKLHPDNLVGDKEAQDMAGKKLSRMNEIYSNVFRRNETREVYDRLCAYRSEYARLVSIQDPDKLQLGANNLSNLKKQIKTANMPNELVAEIDMALDIIKKCRNVVAQ